jgi:putative spermidine/putrescine transport system permease protein
MSLNAFDPMLLVRETVTFANWAKALGDPFHLTLLARTILLGVIVTAFTALLGVPLAWRIWRATGRTKSLLMIAVLSPLMVNLVVRTYAWMVLLGDKGVLNGWAIALGLTETPLPLMGNWGGVIVGLAQVTLPFMVLALTGVLETIDPRVLEAAESLGATPGRVFRRVVWPLMMPGLGAGSVLVFAYAISAFVTPVLLGGGRVPTIATVIYQQFTYTMNWPLGAALVFVLLALTLVVIWAQGRLFRDRTA